MTNEEITAEYLQGLANSKVQLSQNLSTMGVEASVNEKLDTLVAKVLDIEKMPGILTGSVTFNENVAEYTISNIPFVPAKAAIACDHVLTDKLIVAANTNLIAILNIDFPLTSAKLTELTDSGSMNLDDVSESVNVTVADTGNGTYSLTLSLTEFNATAEKPYLFKSNHEYNWLVVGDEWFSQGGGKNEA